MFFSVLILKGVLVKKRMYFKLKKDKRRSRSLYPWLLWLLNGHVTSKNLVGQETCWVGGVGFKYSSNGENPDLEIKTSEDRVLSPFFHKMMYRVLTSKSKHIESNVCFKSLKKHSSYIYIRGSKNLKIMTRRCSQ